MIQRFKQITRQMAHSVRERGPDIFLVLLVVLVLASATGVAQSAITYEYDQEPPGWTVTESESNNYDVGSHDIGPYGPDDNIVFEWSAEWEAFDSDGQQSERRPMSIVGDNATVEIRLEDGNPNSQRDALEVFWSNGTQDMDSRVIGEYSTYDNNPTNSVTLEYEDSTGEWIVRVEDGSGNLVNNFEITVPANTNLNPSDFDTARYGGSTSHGNLQTSESQIELTDGGADSIVNIQRLTVTGETVQTATPEPTPTPTPLPPEERLEMDTRTLMEPGKDYPYTVYYWTQEGQYGTQRGERQDVTGDATIDIENVSIDGQDVLIIPDSGTFRAVNNSNVSATVNVTATYTANNETLNTSKQIVVAETSVENLEIMPTGITRVWAVGTDNTIFILLIASFMGVAATRFAGAFAGLAAAEMVIVIGWLGGYVGLGMAMVSVFMALFIGLNLAANIDYSVRR